MMMIRITILATIVLCLPCALPTPSPQPTISLTPQPSPGPIVGFPVGTAIATNSDGAFSAISSSNQAGVPIGPDVKGKTLGVGVPRNARISYHAQLETGVTGWIDDDHIHIVVGPTPTPTPQVSPTPSASPTPLPTDACTWFVAADGRKTNDGSKDHPWTLITVWDNHPIPGVIKAGDTICVRGGTYTGGPGRGYHIQLSGTAAAPIVTRAYLDERVTLDVLGVAADGGGYFWVTGLEFTYSDPMRTDSRAGTVSVTAPGVKFINNVFHDGGGAIASNETGYDDEFYGNVVYNIGWDDRLTGHKQGGTGPAFYSSNVKGYKRWYENIVSNDFGIPYHLYSAGGAHLNGLDLQGNVTVNSGYWTRYHDTPYAVEGRGVDNYLIGNRQIIDLTFKNNFSFQREGRHAGNEFGYNVAENLNAIITDNVFINGEESVGRFASLDFERNFIASNESSLYHTPPLASISQVIDNNIYYWYPSRCDQGQSQFFHPGDKAVTIAQWKALGFDARSTFNPCGTRPAFKTWIRPNLYDKNRAHVIVHNPAKTPTINLDLSSFLKSGDKFELRNGQNFYGPFVASGTYTVPIQINMAGLTVAVPIGYDAATMTPLNLMTTGPDFGVFVLIRK